jgi:riboflavin transporter FmnP
LSNPSAKSQRTKKIALLTIFTALYIVLRFIPFSMIIGPSGGYLSLSDFLAPIIGIILGPYLGGASVVIGNLSAIALGRNMMFFGLDFLPDLMAVVATGFLTQQKRSSWAIVVGINAALLAIFMLNPLTTNFVYSIPFAWLHIVAFILLLTPLSLLAAKWIYTMNAKKVTAGIIILVLIGVMMQHLAGNILYEVILNQVTGAVQATSYPPMWTAVFFVYPIERSILILAAVLVGTPLLFLLTRMPFLNPRKITQQTPPQTNPKNNK